jgi:hypothetical protein
MAKPCQAQYGLMIRPLLTALEERHIALQDPLSWRFLCRRVYKGPTSGLISPCPTELPG